MNEKINKISPKTLINSKWTKVDVTNKEKHFIIFKGQFISKLPTIFDLSHPIL